MSKARILITDDEPNIRRILQVAFEKSGVTPTVAESGEAALALLREGAFDCLLTDVTMPGLSGYELLREAQRLHPTMPVIVMTAFGTIPEAIQAIRDGAHEFVTKPFDLEALKRIVDSTLRQRSATASSRRSGGAAPKSEIIAASSAMREVLQLVDQVADSKATVMIGGESGVGKEVVARALHTRSGRANGPFIAVSCAALPESLLESELFGYEKGAFTGANGAKPGRFESADGGTLFLDEIGEIPFSVQVKLLRALQEREIERLGSTKPVPVDVRVVTATHRDLHVAVEQGTFRLDLLYRLQVIELVIPPLRERTMDIVPLAEHFLTKFCAENNRGLLKLDPDTTELLHSYRWPGNVRELENTMERAVVLAKPESEFVSASSLPQTVRLAA
ncbi:MAG: sigma-54-dependent transcriptional regulator [Fimbriimonadaceae bacterium]